MSAQNLGALPQTPLGAPAPRPRYYEIEKFFPITLITTLPRFIEQIQKIVALIVIPILIFSGCNKNNNSHDSIYGIMDGNTYTNDYFDFKITVSDNWTILNREQIDSLSNALFKMKSENIDEETKAIYEQTQQYIKHLLMVLEHPMEYIDGFNPNIQCIAENLELYKDDNISSAKDYLENSRDSYGQSATNILFSDIIEENIGGKIFHKLTIQNYGDAGTMSQDQYSILIKDDYILSFIISYETADQYYELYEMLDSIEF